MHSIFILFCIVLPLYAANADEKPVSAANNRAKRFSSFGGALSTIGGRVGCVVSQNKLFVNGHFTKDLSDDEQEELKQYQDQLEKFKAEVKTYLEERQKQFRSQVAPRQGSDAAEAPKGGAQQQLKKPEPPKKPSFCSDKATTQYVFDGCSVQGDNVYIGDTFVRKLSDAEQKELAQFDQKFTVYQKAVTAGFRKQVEEMFGQHFGALFGGASDVGSSSGGSAEGKQTPSSVGGATELAAPPAAAAGENGGPAPEAPKTPSFCTLLV